MTEKTYTLEEIKDAFAAVKDGEDCGNFNAMYERLVTEHLTRPKHNFAEGQVVYNPMKAKYQDQLREILNEEGAYETIWEIIYWIEESWVNLPVGKMVPQATHDRMKLAVKHLKVGAHTMLESL